MRPPSGDATSPRRQQAAYGSNVQREPCHVANHRDAVHPRALHQRSLATQTEPCLESNRKRDCMYASCACRLVAQAPWHGRGRSRSGAAAGTGAAQTGCRTDVGCVGSAHAGGFGMLGPDQHVLVCGVMSKAVTKCTHLGAVCTFAGRRGGRQRAGRIVEQQLSR